MKRRFLKATMFLMVMVCALLLVACPDFNGADLNSTDDTDDTTDPIVATDPVAATANVSKGVDFLITEDFVSAQASFKLALVADPTNTDAQFWVSFMDMAALSVDPTVVDLFKNRVGVVKYPASLNTLLSDSWFDADYYFSRQSFQTSETGIYVRGRLGTTSTSSYTAYYVSNKSIYDSFVNFDFIPDETGTYYAQFWYNSAGSPVSSSSITGTKYERLNNIVDALCDTTVLPELEIPGFMADFGIDPDFPIIYSYPLILAANVAVNSPAGFNTIVDTVNTVALGTTLTTILSRIEALSDTVRVTIPATLMTTYSSPEAMADLNGATVSLGKAELLLWAAQLQLSRAFVQYLASVDFSYNLGVILDAYLATDFNSLDDIDANDIPDQIEELLAATPGFFSSDLLTDRDASKRAASKTSFLAAVNNLKAAATLIKTQWANPASYYNTTATTLEMPYDIRENVAPNLQSAIYAADALATAINSNAVYYVPDNTYVSGAPWPTSGMAIKPAALWASNALDPRAWLETDANGFVPYVNYYNASGSIEDVVKLGDNMTEASYSAITSPTEDFSGYIVLKSSGKMLDFYPDFPQELYPMYMPVKWFALYDYVEGGSSVASWNPPVSATFIIDWVNK